jgi:hypothetical protein
MNTQSLNFVEKYTKGMARFPDILDHIDYWHQSDYKVKLHDFLGLTEYEHMLFVENDDLLENILKAKRKKFLKSQFKLIICS